MQTAKSAVLILGAGSSRDYGFPLGTELADRIRTAAPAIAAYVRDNPPPPRTRGITDNFLAELHGFLDRLPHSGADTVDEFIGLAEGTPWGFAASVATAYIISEAEAGFIRNKFVPHGWYKDYAVRLCEDMLPRGSGTHKAPTINAVTFNYDMSLEWAAASVMYGRRSMGFCDAIGCVPQICHVHGRTRLPHLASGQRLAEKVSNEILSKDWNIYTAAEELRLVCATNGQSNCSPVEGEVEYAKRLLKEADVVAFLGFGFHQSCLDTLDISPSSGWCKADALVTASLFDVRAELKRFDELRRRVHPKLSVFGDSNVDSITCLTVFRQVAGLVRPNEWR